MNKIRFAIIGTNFISMRFLEAARLVNQFELAAVYSRSKEKGRTFIQDIKRVEVFDNLDDLAKAKDIDAVYIASPTCCHAAQSIQMLKSKKHVFCEKPVASNSLEWKKMMKAADENKVIVLEAMRPLFTPGYKRIKENLLKVGNIRRVSLSYCQYSSRYDQFKKGIRENAFRPELSNGALMDIGVYCVEVLVGLFGKPSRICAHGYILPESIDGMGSVTAVYDGMQADLVYSKITDSKIQCEIQGEKGTLYFNDIVGPRNISIRYRDGSCEILPEDANPCDMTYEIETFMDMIHTECFHSEYNKISSAAMEVIDEARRQIGIVFPADLY